MTTKKSRGLECRFAREHAVAWARLLPGTPGRRAAVTGARPGRGGLTPGGRAELDPVRVGAPLRRAHSEKKRGRGSFPDSWSRFRFFTTVVRTK